MSIPKATAADILAGRAESDAQDFNDELIPVDPYRESGGDLAPGVVAQHEEMDRAAEDLLVGLRQLQGGEEIRWNVFRTGEMDDTRNGFLIECATSNLTQTWLRDNFGGGTYRIRGHYPNGKYAAQRTIRVAGDAPRKNQLSPADGKSSFDVQAFIAQQDARDRARQRDEEQRRTREDERDEKRRKERLEMIAALAPLFAPAVAGLIGNKGPDVAALITAIKPPPPPDPLQQMAALKALMGNGNDGAMTKILPMLIEMAGQQKGGGGADTGWLDIVKELAKSAGPTLGGMIEASVLQAKANATAAAEQGSTNAGVPNKGGAPALTGPAQLPPAGGISPGAIILPDSRPRRERAPAGGIPVPTHAAPQGPQGQADMNLMVLLPHLPWLKEQLSRMGLAATKARDPELYAALFLEELPETIDVNIVGQLLARADWYQQLCQIEPRLNREDLLAWFTALRAAILQSLQQESGAAVATHAPTQPGSDPRAAARVEVKGPADAAPQGPSRPTKLPSLSGD